MCTPVKGRVDMKHSVAYVLVLQAFKHKITLEGARSCIDVEGTFVTRAFCGVNKGSLTQPCNSLY